MRASCEVGKILVFYQLPSSRRAVTGFELKELNPPLFGKPSRRKPVDNPKIVLRLCPTVHHKLFLYDELWPQHADCRCSGTEKGYHTADEDRTRNLRLRKATRYHCATTAFLEPHMEARSSWEILWSNTTAKRPEKRFPEEYRPTVFWYSKHSTGHAGCLSPDG